MGLIAGALLDLNGRMSLAGWQWLFLVEALPAVVLGVVYFFYLPDGPVDAAWLTEEERAAILARVPPVPHMPGHSVVRVLADSRVWLLGAFMFFMLCSAYVYNFFAPAILIKVTGFSVTRVGFVLAAANLAGAAAMIANGILSDRRRAPFAHVLPGCFLISAGFLALALAKAPAPAILGSVLLVVGQYSLQGPLWAIATAFLAGRSAAAAVAAMNTLGIVGGFIGPYWMGAARDLTGDYQRGLLTMTAPMLVAAGIMLYLRRRTTGLAESVGLADPVPSLP
jgi:ACS family tartrate transporter-like MFS transporter